LPSISSSFASITLIRTLVHTHDVQVGYLGFGFLWTYLFIAAIGVTTISGCVVYFYYMDADTAAEDRQRFMQESRFSDNQTDWPVLTMLW
tara:strand:- start:14 stop:283 length:270 start_codon:yes stop_codon:yes gene_type:complete